jgi:hypothetical protein
VFRGAIHEVYRTDGARLGSISSKPAVSVPEDSPRSGSRDQKRILVPIAAGSRSLYESQSCVGVAAAQDFEAELVVRERGHATHQRAA